MSTPMALTLPLQGTRLIEASAGTGKTFTISALYVRLVLGHGGPDSCFPRVLLPPQILVVTFTEAATQELRDRIRSRLTQAATFFRQQIAAPDALLQALRDEYAAEQWPSCAYRLDMAAQWMDEAAVSTIHSWCQRMLREHAFDSGSLFTQQLETDHTELLACVIRDYWRSHFYALQGAALAWVGEHWQTPTYLQQRLQPLMGAGLGSPDGQSVGTLILQHLQQRDLQLQQLKAPWLAWVDELRALCDRACQEKRVNGRKFQARWYVPWFEALAQWATTPEQAHLDLGTGFERLTPQGMAEVWKDAPAFEHPGLQALAELPGALADLADPDIPLLQHALGWVEQRFEEEKRQRAQMGFDDMLSRLSAALSGTNGERLATLIRQQFPVAMIDEFQDTDPVQYDIFRRVYRIGEAPPEDGEETALLLIGDPKQAIYAFRGADIHTYLEARQATPGRYTLDTNFRSSQPLVAAVNQVFLQGERHARGAFLFRRGEDNPLPFEPVKAQGRKDVLRVAGGEPAALTLWHLEGEAAFGRGEYQQQMAARAASEIVALLDLGQRGLAGFQREGEVLRALAPSDIAVLVRDSGEARAIRQELRRRGVRSVYLSDKQSVFRSREARDLLAWLKACAEPDDERLLRAALASPTLGLALADLDHLCRDELDWERQVLRFRDYRQLWRRQGVLPMLRRLLHDFQLPARLFKAGDGERGLTNLLHLAELMQQAAADLDGEQALIRHLAEHLAHEGQTADEQILRLESDALLVKVVTIHKSKGLEYPLVFLPFICAFRPVDASRPPLRFHDRLGQLQVALRPGVEELRAADDERLGEDLRLLYVALTRARHACWLGVAQVRDGKSRDSGLHRTALGHLLNGGEPFELGQALAGLQDACPDVQVLPAPEASEQRLLRGQDTSSEAVTAKRPRRSVAENWWIASYSALALASADPEQPDDEPPALESAWQERLHDDDRESGEFAWLPGAADLHRFPRGPQAGTFLHGLFEWAGQEGFAKAVADPELRRETLARRCNVRGWESWIDPLDQWLCVYLDTHLPLGEGHASLQLSSLQRYQVEMEFWFASHWVDARELDHLARRYLFPGAARPALAPARLNGMFKGFIDLVFEHQGRFYVADYKSNWLGEGQADYHGSRLQEAMLEHRYDLQLALYLLALHRLLKIRLADTYDYDQHVGGALYLFLRGAESGVWLERPPREFIEALDALFSRQEVVQ